MRKKFKDENSKLLYNFRVGWLSALKELLQKLKIEENVKKLNDDNNI